MNRVIRRVGRYAAPNQPLRTRKAEMTETDQTTRLYRLAIERGKAAAAMELLAHHMCAMLEYLEAAPELERAAVDRFARHMIGWNDAQVVRVEASCDQADALEREITR